MRMILRLMRVHLKRHTRAMIVRFLIAAVVAATPYVFSFLGKWLVDEALQVTGPPKSAAAAQPAESAAGPGIGIAWKARTPDQKLRLLLVFLSASMGIHVLVTGLSVLAQILNTRTNEQMAYELRSAVHDKVSRLEMGLFSREQIGQLMTRVMDDAGAIPANLTNLVINVCVQSAMLVLGLVLLLRLNVRMTLAALAALPFYAATCVVFLPRMRKVTEDLRTRVAQFNGFVVERLSSIVTIKNYAQEDRELERFCGTIERNQRLARTQHHLSLFFGTLTTLITAFATLAVLAFGFLNIQAQRMQLGEVLAFYQVTAQLFVPISALVGLGNVVQSLQVLARRVYGVLDMPETITEAPDAVEPAQIEGRVEFRGVALRYQEGGPFAVQDVSLAIPAGATVCLVGPTGCGKSTLLSLLTRLYDPTDGTICIDGTDIRRFRLRALRRTIGNIFHDCTVFSGTVAQNIRYGAPGATQADVEAAARLVELHDFVAAQPKGYGALLGRGGLALGTEERVKLAIARALITRPAILTVDDTFSTIEEDVEARLRQALHKALGGRTVLIATSRLSICEDVDLVVVMRRGRIEQVGTHAELLAAPGTYRRMYMRQMGLDSV